MIPVLETSKVVTLDPDGRTVVYNSGGSNQPDIQVPVIPAGAFGKDARVCEVRLKSGAVHTFGGDLLKQAIANGARILRVVQEGK